MQLKYRGVDYDYRPPAVEMEPSRIIGQYRGLEWRFRRPKAVAVQQPTLNLMYRGVAYTTGQTQSVPEPVAVRQPVNTVPVSHSVAGLARALMMGHHGLIKRRQQSMLGRVAAEVGLGIDASHYWGHIQGKVRPGFRRSYDRSHVALS